MGLGFPLGLRWVSIGSPKLSRLSSKAETRTNINTGQNAVVEGATYIFSTIFCLPLPKQDLSYKTLRSSSIYTQQAINLLGRCGSVGSNGISLNSFCSFCCKVPPGSLLRGLAHTLLIWSGNESLNGLNPLKHVSQASAQC